MSDTSIDKIYKCIETLKINAYAGDLAGFLDAENMSPEEIHAISRMLGHLCQQKEETIRHTLLKMSRLPLKEPKSFEKSDDFIWIPYIY